MNPPAPAYNASPVVHLIVNEQWSSVIAGFLAAGEFDTFWDSDPVRAAQQIMLIQEQIAEELNVALKNSLIIVAEQKPQNTPAGAFTSGAWRTRAMNVELYDPGNFVVVGVPAVNQISIEPGWYFIYAELPARQVNSHQARLWNLSDSLALLNGQNASAAAADTTQTNAVLCGTFLIPSPKVIEVQHQCQTTKTIDGMGIQNNFGIETYAIAAILRLGDV